MKRTIVSVVLAATAAVTTPALASGSGSGSGGGGAGVGGFNRFDSVLDEQQRLEERGRSQVKKRITCKACEYKDGVTRQNAGAVAQAVRSGSFELTKKDREAVLFFLKQRYGV